MHTIAYLGSLEQTVMLRVLAFVLVGSTMGILSDRRKRAEEIHHLNNKLVRHINQLIVQVDSEPELLQNVCNQLIDGRSYKLAWIGFIQKGSHDVWPVAQAGFEEGYLSSVKMTWNNSEYGQEPAGTTIETGQPSIMRDILNNPLP